MMGSKKWAPGPISIRCEEKELLSVAACSMTQIMSCRPFKRVTNNMPPGMAVTIAKLLRRENATRP